MKTSNHHSERKNNHRDKVIKALKRAERIAWFFFVVLGLGYIALSLILQPSFS